MDWFKPKDEEEKKEPEVIAEIPKLRVKDETICVEEGCFEPKAPAQTYLCARHMRSN